MISQFKRVTSPFSVMMFQQLGNASNRVASGDTAFSYRDASVRVGGLVRLGRSWRIRNTRPSGPGISPRRCSHSLLVHTSTNLARRPKKERLAYGPLMGIITSGLAALKKKYDPTNLFSHNQNVRPKV